MSDDSSQQVTTLLAEIRAGRREAEDRLVRLVYDELHRLAGGFMRRERAHHTWQATELVSEAMLRLLCSDALRDLKSRAYFFGAAAQAMRRALVEHARQRRGPRRGGNRVRVPLDDLLDEYERQRLDMLAVDEALNELARLNERQYRVTSLRFFGGLSIQDIAEQVEVSIGTVESDLRIARAWLRSRMSPGP